jgi:hypothetical protein
VSAPATGAGDATPATAPAPRAAALFFGVAVVVLLSRLPFLSAGYGSDSDAWRVAGAARVIAETGRYTASRFPGYPVQEIGSALLWRGGPLALNGASAVLTALAAGLFALVLRRRGVLPAAWGGLALGLAPAVYIQSTSALDYTWALAFGVLSCWLALERRPVLAGAALGAAIGCRLSSIGFALPVAAWLLEATPARRRRSLMRFAAGLLATSLLVLSPVLATYGFAFLSYYPWPSPAPLYVIKGMTTELWGVLGSIGIATGTGAAAIGIARGRGGTLHPLSGWEWGGVLGGLAFFVVLYLRVPYKAAYLLPAIPLTLFLLGRCLAAPWFRAVCLLVIVSPFLIKISEPGKADAPSLSRAAGTVTMNGRRFDVDLLQGPVLWEHARRRAGLRYRDAVLHAARERLAAGPVAIVAQEWIHWLRPAIAPADSARLRVFHFLDGDRASALLGQGFRLYYLRDVPRHNRAQTGLDLETLGARPLLPSDAPAPGGAGGEDESR